MNIKKFRKDNKNAITNVEWSDLKHRYTAMQFYFEERFALWYFLNVLTDTDKIKVEYINQDKMQTEYYDFNKLSKKYQDEILNDLNYNQKQMDSRKL